MDGQELVQKYDIPSASHCQFECQKLAACFYFTYNIQTAVCWLKTGINIIN